MSQHLLVLPQREQWKARTPHRSAATLTTGNMMQAARNSTRISNSVLHIDWKPSVRWWELGCVFG